MNLSWYRPCRRLLSVMVRGLIARRTGSKRATTEGLLGLRALSWPASLARPYVGRLAVASLGLLLSSCVSLLLPIMAGRLVDATVVDRSLDRLHQIVLGLLALFALAMLLQGLQKYILRSTASYALRHLRASLYTHVLKLSAGFFERERVGELLSRLNSDVSAIGETLTQHLVGGLHQALVLLGALAIMLIIHPYLTGLMLVVLPPIVVAALFFGRRLERLARSEQERVAAANVAAEESLAGIRTVQAFTRELEEGKRYEGRLGRIVEIAVYNAGVESVFQSVIGFFAFGALTLVAWYGGTLVIRDELSAGQLTALLFYSLFVAGAIGALGGVYGALRRAAGATARIRELMDTSPAVLDPPDPFPLPATLGRITFRNVTFAYPSKPGLRVVDKLSLDVRPGEVVALVGPSGGGKSTLVALLLRFYDPSEGTISIEDVDVRRFRLTELREAIGLVPQDVFFFGGTVAENIRYGRPEADDGSVEAASRAACIHRVIASLPRGYDTGVGERGVQLSAGERQRIAIARVMLKDPAIVVLDEATSSLDAESDHQVQQAFMRLCEGRTTLVIAHRLATVKRANRVILLDRGRIVEEGTHRDLLAKAGAYRRLCKLQMLDDFGPLP